MNPTLLSTRTFNINALVKSTNLDSSCILQYIILQLRFTIGVKVEMMRMTRHTEDIIEMFTKAIAYLPLRHSHLEFSPTKK